MTIDYSLHVFRSALFKSVVQEAITFFEQTPCYNLPPSDSFEGVGVYALYLVNKNTIYKQIADPDLRRPIYVGKAVPSGWRTARNTEISGSTALSRRLREHSRSIDQATNLELNDFQCRFMLLNKIEADLIVLVEAELIRQQLPIWNTAIDGFGNHDPGRGRYNQAKSEWDVLHPGRTWASKLTGVSTTSELVLEKINTYILKLSL